MQTSKDAIDEDIKDIRQQLKDLPDQVTQSLTTMLNKQVANIRKEIESPKRKVADIETCLDKLQSLPADIEKLQTKSNEIDQWKNLSKSIKALSNKVNQLSTYDPVVPRRKRTLSYGVENEDEGFEGVPLPPRPKRLSMSQRSRVPATEAARYYADPTPPPP